MNIAKNLKNIIKANNRDTMKEEDIAISVIIDKFCQDNLTNNSIEFDIYFKDSFGKYSTRIWDNNDLSEKEQRSLYIQAAKDLMPLCNKLKKYGFKCKVIAKISEAYGKQVLHTPWISVEV
jgi:hypothetical protein